MEQVRLGAGSAEGGLATVSGGGDPLEDIGGGSRALGLAGGI